MIEMSLGFTEILKICLRYMLLVLRDLLAITLLVQHLGKICYLNRALGFSFIFFFIFPSLSFA